MARGNIPGDIYPGDIIPREIVERSSRKQGQAMPAAVAQSVERVLGKDEVKGSSPLSSSEWFAGT